MTNKIIYICQVRERSENKKLDLFFVTERDKIVKKSYAVIKNR